MPIDVSDLTAHGVDVAGAVKSAFLNKFSAAHHAKYPELYKHSMTFPQFENKLRLDYKVGNPLVFQLSPLSKSRFRSLYLSHAKARNLAGYAEYVDTPPNVRLTSKGVDFDFIVFKPDGTPDYDVPFKWDLEALCAVELVQDTPSTRQIRLEPISVEFSKPKGEIVKEIIDGLRKAAAKSGSKPNPNHSGGFGNPADSDWCTKVENLILFIVNEVLALSIGGFVREFELPRAIELYDSVSLSPNYLSIHDDSLVVGAKVLYAAEVLEEAQAAVTSFLTEFLALHRSEMESLTDDELLTWEPAKSPAYKYLQTKERELGLVTSDVQPYLKEPLEAFDENLQLFTNGALFDALARKVFSYRRGATDSTSFNCLIGAEYGWSLIIDAGHGGIVNGGIEVGASIDLRAFVNLLTPKLCKHPCCWYKNGVCVRVQPEPDFTIDAILNFRDNGVYGNAVLRTRDLAFSFCQDVPDIVNKIIKAITGFLTQPVLDIIRAIVQLFAFRIIRYPGSFPGTTLSFTPRLNPRPLNVGQYLAITGDPSF
ncbi:MAG TPA: hypothetical protein VHE55_09315 [Fimbriimonadaceae bacterium]|nr:hypothetical protein [Fimbriimonadaceae bacterium]